MLFILGRGRSGTSLISSILNQHEDIAVPPEGCFIRNCHSRFKGGLSTPKNTRDFVKTMMTENRMKNWGFDRPELENSIQDRLPLTFQEACEFVIGHWAELQGFAESEILADKNPHYSLWAKELGGIFPTARFVHVVRNPFDNIASFQNVRFDISDAIGLALRWSVFNEGILDANLGDRRFEIRYEDLVESPEEAIRNLCAFLEVGYSDELLNHQISKDQLSPWHQNLSKPITSGRVGYGLDQISSQQANCCNSIVAPVAKRLGYEIAEIGTRPSSYAPFRGKFSLFSEKNIYRLPLNMRNRIINNYRRRVGSI